MAVAPAVLSLLLAAFFFHALVYVIRGSTLPHRMGSTASCGRCGYAYSGLARCPECGSDVSEAGVLTPRLAFRLRGGVLSVAIALLVVVAIGTIPVAQAVSALASSLGYSRTTLDRTFVPTPSATTVAPNSYEVDLVGDLVSRAGPATSGTLTVAVSSKPVTHGAGNWIARSGLPRAEIDAGSGAVRLYDASGTSVRAYGSFDDEASAALYTLSGLDVSNSEVRTGCQSLVQHVQAELRSPGVGLTTPGVARPTAPLGALNFAGGSSSSGPGLPFTVLGRSREGSVAALVTIGAILVYVVALATIVRRRRRLMRG